MSFSSEFERCDLGRWRERSMGATAADVERVFRVGVAGLEDFSVLLSPEAGGRLESLCQWSRRVTQSRFGRVIRLYAPLYLSNECINQCAYCGFSRDNPILRVTLTPGQVRAEAEALRGQGFRSVLLVAGEHRKFVSPGYLVDCVREVVGLVPSVSLEVGPMEAVDYAPLVEAGAEGLVVYQETYDRGVYAAMHTAGPKRDFAWRLETPERAYAAGFRRLGIGALYGLADWRVEAMAVAAHALHLLRHCWKAQLTVSFPRLRPCAGEFEPLTVLADREFVQLIAAFRVFLPDVGLVLSTREPARLRDGLLGLGITHASAGSHTEPGGYTGAGATGVHRTVRGRIVAGDEGAAVLAGRATAATGQFEIADDRSPAEVAARIRSLGLEPVWKDWDSVLSGGGLAPGPGG